MDADRQAQLYAQEMGAAAFARQAKMKQETCPECWAKEGKHAATCKRGQRIEARRLQELQNPRRTTPKRRGDAQGR